MRSLDFHFVGIKGQVNSEMMFWISLPWLVAEKLKDVRLAWLTSSSENASYLAAMFTLLALIFSVAN